MSNSSTSIHSSNHTCIHWQLMVTACTLEASKCFHILDQWNEEGWKINKLSSIHNVFPFAFVINRILLKALSPLSPSLSVSSVPLSYSTSPHSHLLLFRSTSPDVVVSLLILPINEPWRSWIHALPPISLGFYLGEFSLELKSKPTKDIYSALELNVTREIWPQMSWVQQ